MKMISRVAWAACRKSGLATLFTDELFIRIQYRCMTGKHLRLNPPVDFNEKIQWLKLNYRNPLIVQCADKYAVRDFVGERIGERYLAKCIGVYDRADEVDFEALPNRFVMKATHASGWNIICPDKMRLNQDLALRKIRNWLRKDYSQNGREWQYRQIEPRMICEEFLSDSNGAVIKDYKLLTFHGETKYIWVDHVESVESGFSLNALHETGYSKPKLNSRQIRYRDFYDANWNLKHDVSNIVESANSTVVSKPECLDEMLDVAYKLAHDFPQCRVDLYVIDGKRIVFGELTFSSDNGCSNNYVQSFNDELGSYVELPEAIA